MDTNGNLTPEQITTILTGIAAVVAPTRSDRWHRICPAWLQERTHSHVFWIGTGAIISVALSFIPMNFVGHIAICLPAVPAVIQEVMDKIFNW